MKQFTIPSGMRDQILGECEIKKQLQLKIESSLDKWGYKEVITPTIEFYKTYEEGFRDIKEQDMYKFFDAQGRILMLRADMTIPIARVVATKFKDATTPLRFRYCANVFKVHEELSGLRNEISECGVELIGMEEKCGDLEILVTALEALKVVDNRKWILEIGNIAYFNEACRLSNIEGIDKEELADLINTKRMQELNEKLLTLQLTKEQSMFFKMLPWINGDVSILEEARKYAFAKELENILDSMQSLYDDLHKLGYEDVNFDLGKAANLNYYTGIIFEAYVEGVGNKVLSGGRYDTLISRYGRNLPATGFAIKLDALLDIIEKKEEKISYKISYHPNYRVEALMKAKELQKENTVTLCVDEKENTYRISREG